MKTPKITIARAFAVSDEEMEEAERRIAGVWPIIAEWELERLAKLYSAASPAPPHDAGGSDGRIRLLYCC